MNKINIDGVLIVEGIADVSYLSNFVNALFFTTNGYDLSEEKINFLKRAAKVNKLIIYTDPDEAGEEIRKCIKTQINPIFEAKSEKNTRKNYKKSGVAELDKEEVVRALSPFATSEEKRPNNYHLSLLISLRLTGSLLLSTTIISIPSLSGIESKSLGRYLMAPRHTGTITEKSLL